MAKRWKKMTAGPLVKEIIYTAPEPLDGPKTRAAKSRATTAAQKAMNDKTARSKCEMVLAGNFGRGDYVVTFTYRDTDLPRNRKAAVANAGKFFRRFRQQMARLGKEAKYLYVTENKHGDGRFHHHAVISGQGLSYEQVKELVASLWSWGEVTQIAPLRVSDPNCYGQLAEYFTKEGGDRPVGARMWSGNRNLKPPKVEWGYVTDDVRLERPENAYTLERSGEQVTAYGSGYSYIKYRLFPSIWTPPGQQGDERAFDLSEWQGCAPVYSL